MVQVTETMAAQVDWAGWLRRWDVQQSRYMTREERFEAMLDAVDGTVAQEGDIVALDIACGPGAISQRLLERFPAASSIAVDVDPDRNQLKFKRESASLDDPAYKPFWGFVYDEGAISLGIELNYDWMHWQFARL